MAYVALSTESHMKAWAGEAVGDDDADLTMFFRMTVTPSWKPWGPVM